MARLRRAARWRRFLLLLSLVLTTSLLGRGHTLAAMGLQIACEHGGSAAHAHADEGDAHGTSGDEDCPPNCHDCPCGQMPMHTPDVPGPPPVFVALRVLDELAPVASRGRAPPLGLDRPPRLARG